MPEDEDARADTISPAAARTSGSGFGPVGADQFGSCLHVGMLNPLDCLRGAKPVWLEQYRQLPKARRAFGMNLPVIANLEQNPASRPILSRWLPCLLRSGTMWWLQDDAAKADSERMLLPED